MSPHQPFIKYFTPSDQALYLHPKYFLNVTDALTYKHGHFNHFVQIRHNFVHALSPHYAKAPWFIRFRYAHRLNNSPDGAYTNNDSIMFLHPLSANLIVPELNFLRRNLNTGPFLMKLTLISPLSTVEYSRIDSLIFLST